jgi:hypothetical protein
VAALTTALITGAFATAAGLIVVTSFAGLEFSAAGWMPFGLYPMPAELVMLEGALEATLTVKVIGGRLAPGANPVTLVAQPGPPYAVQTPGPKRFVSSGAQIQPDPDIETPVSPAGSVSVTWGNRPGRRLDKVSD